MSANNFAVKEAEVTKGTCWAFNSDFETGDILKVSDYIFGKSLIENFGEQKTKEILNNPTIKFKNKSVSIFDLTEEMNSDECIEVLKELKDQM